MGFVMHTFQNIELYLSPRPKFILIATLNCFKVVLQYMDEIRKLKHKLKTMKLSYSNDFFFQ